MASAPARSAQLVLFRFFGLLLLPSLAAHAQASFPTGARYVVVLDAAHGGEDNGGNLSPDPKQSEPEKALTLAISVRLRSLLAARGISVVTTRESDVALDAQQRAETANHAQPQACISLHAATSGNGLHLFLSSLAPAAPARFLAWKTAQAAYVNRSIALAGVLNSALVHAGNHVTIGRTGLTTIDSMTCPAVAIEIAPEKKPDGTLTPLEDPDYQARIAEALSAGLLQWRSEPRQP